MHVTRFVHFLFCNLKYTLRGTVEKSMQKMVYTLDLPKVCKNEHPSKE